MTKQQVIEQRRRRGDEDWAERFDKLGLSNRFILLRRDWNSAKGRKIVAKCKKCGAEFSTWAFKEIFEGKQTHLLCPECGASSDGNDLWTRSAQADAAMSFYAEGHSVKETAEKFGVPKSQVSNLVRQRGLTNGKDWHESRAEKQREEAEKKLSERVQSFGFAYLGGYSVKGCKVEIQCEKCGTKYERTADFLKKGNVVCRKCEHEKVLARQAWHKEERAEELKQKAIDRKQNKERAEVEKADALFHLLNDKAHMCVVCGRFFSIADYMRDCGLKQIQHDPKYCSDACKRKHNNRLSKECKRRRGVNENHRHRAKKYGCDYDSTVTLAKLIKRDGLRCAICGEMCDWNDHSWSKYAGPKYPSIDHIIPMSKGGGHVWDNVQVAHIICNSEKGNR